MKINVDSWKKTSGSGRQKILDSIETLLYSPLTDNAFEDTTTEEKVEKFLLDLKNSIEKANREIEVDSLSRWKKNV